MKLFRVMRWEFGKMVRSKQFLVMTVFIPVLLVVAALAFVLATGTDGPADGGEPPPRFVLVIWLALLLFIGAFLSAIMTLYAVVKEKGSRVVELMLSSVSAMDLMGGKILGIGLAGLIQVITWSAAIGFVASRFIPISLGVFSAVHFVTYPLYFGLGYLFIATLYATVGAGMKDVHSGGVQGLVGMIPYSPMIFVAAIIQFPDVVWVRIAGLLPPFAPAIMMVRLAVTDVPWWEVLVSLSLLAISVVLLMRFAAKVFDVAMLMYGKSATLREIWRWGVRSH